MASALDDRESQALRTGSLMAIPPPPPRSQPLPGSPAVDLLGNNLTQWADHVQDMRLPPKAVAECPTSDIVGVLDRLEGMTWVRYYRLCFGVCQQCRCLAVPHQAPGPTAALWMLSTASYVAMALPTETTASTSAVGVTHSSYQSSGLPPLEAMDMLSPPTTENLLLTAGVGRGIRGQTQPWIPTPGRQEATSATPYWQQVYPPITAAPRPSATPSATQSQGREGLAREEPGARGRSSSRGSRDGQRGNRSSTRGLQKCRRGTEDSDLIDEMANYMASGWRQDLIHMVGCCWAAQVGLLDDEEWCVAIEKFISVMTECKRKWTDVKELMPLKFMPYMAKLFKEVTGKDLQGLGQFTGWIGLGGYYHWRVAQQGLIHLVPPPPGRADAQDTQGPP